ncbi:MAG TPA: hypothetical protein VLD62_03085, partial [Acidimicrobiia bacterium]|nr:hypothetical protein [Acidimicrobiia bacterium]
LDEACRRAEAILEQIAENPGLPGTWEPLRIHLSVVQVLEAAGDDRAPGVLAGAYDLLMDRCERITDPGDRAMFLDTIPWHREIIERAAG